jgi:hypothetical protein
MIGDYLFRLFNIQIDSQGVFCLDILTHDEQIDEETIVLTGFFAIEATKKSLYVHFMGIDLIDTMEDRWFLP